MNAIFTVGHSTYSIGDFTDLIMRNAIDVVCDVRSKPYSRFNPQFNREPLKASLRDRRLKYVFLGKELGARSEDPACYRDGRVQYDLLAKTELFSSGIARVKEGARTYRVALMCAEKEPLECHRTILISRRLDDDGLAVEHILSDGTTETHRHALERLVAKLRIPSTPLLRSQDDVINEAYAVQGREIAYQEAEVRPEPYEIAVSHRAHG